MEIEENRPLYTEDRIIMSTKEFQNKKQPKGYNINPTLSIHCYKTDGEIPVHTYDDTRRQRSTTGKYFPYESGVNTCFAPAVYHKSEFTMREANSRNQMTTAKIF